MFQKLVIVFVQITSRYIIILSLVCWCKIHIVCILKTIYTLLSKLQWHLYFQSSSLFQSTHNSWFPTVKTLQLTKKLWICKLQKSSLQPTDIPFCSCFIGEVGVLFGAFLVPILAILIFNFVVLVMVIRVIITHSKSKDTSARHTAKQLLISVFGITFLFGMSWVFGAFTISDASPVFKYLFAMFTSSQGFFIFIFICVIGKEGRELWINLLCCGHKLPSIPLYKKSGEGSTGMQNNPMKLLKLSSMYFRRPSTTSSMQNDKTLQYSDTSTITM